MVPPVMKRAILVIVSTAALCGCVYPPIGLEPLYPRPITGLVVGVPKYTPIDSLQPTLRWSAFPRAEDRSAHGQEFILKISDITYDLRIWRQWDCQIWPREGFSELFHEDPDYARDGIADAFHRVEVPLKPSARYCWAVRARFLVDGHPRKTEWARQGMPMFNEQRAYGFQAPGG